MKLIIVPDHGLAPLVAAMKNAKKSIEMAIFRFDRRDMEAAMKVAAANGVKITTLIARSSSGSEKSLRKLEMRFLEAGFTVVRSADDLVRYHDKLMIIDRRILCLLSFNYSHMDIDQSRGFGILTKNTRWVQEAARLFEADCTRTPYTPGLDTFVVSPANSRRVLSSFLKRAKKQLLIYDPNIVDKDMIRVLHARTRAGVEIRIIGRIAGRTKLPARMLQKLRLHTRTIIRDRHQAFVGSQSLRPLELDSRREAGLIIREAKIVKQLIETFEADWSSAGVVEEAQMINEPPAAAPKLETEKAVQVLVQELQPIANTVKKAMKKVAARAGEEALEDKFVKETVRKAVKQAMKKAVEEAVLARISHRRR